MVHDESFDTIQITTTEAEAEAQLDAMLDNLFKMSQWHHTDLYSDCASPEATHHYFDSSWDLAFERAQANSQREHERCQSNGTSCKCTHDYMSNPEISISEGEQ
jgi:hypothetical protein